MNKTLPTLKNIFFKKFILLFIIIFITLGIISFFWTKELHIKQIKIDLLHDIDIFSLQIENIKNIDKNIKNIKNLTGLRITIINKEGFVIGESNKNKSNMDNHLNRTEILKSNYNEYGDAIRYSKTLKKDLLYIAKKYTINRKIYYIRMARDIEKINKDFFSISIKIFLLFVIFLSFLFYIALKINKNIQTETQNILFFLLDLAKQSKAKKINSDYSIEFYKITKLLTQTSEKLSKRNKEKQKYTTKLKLANKQKDNIISAISHEFKNPITVINGYTQTLLEDQEIDRNIQNKFLKKISFNTKKITNLIDRLRLSSKLEKEKQTNNLKKTNLNNIIQNQINNLKQVYPNRIISFNSSSNNIFKEIDKTLMEIAITNLIENSLKYSKDKIDVNLSYDKLQITDYGIGISKLDMENITKKFFRVSKNEWNNSLGMGLFLVKNILNIHKFKLDIKSKKDVGSTFSIIF